MASNTQNIHVLLADHDGKDHDKITKMLEHFSYQVTTTKLASTALSLLSKEELHFDIVMANVNSPDLYVFKLLDAAVKKDLLVILMLEDDDVTTTMKALEQEAFLCIRKPITMQLIGCLWQLVLREKKCRLKENQQLGEAMQSNGKDDEFDEDLIMEAKKSDEEQKAKKKMKCVKDSTNDIKRVDQDNVMFKKKVWTEWTQELHEKFMDAITKLGEGRCYPKEILELMNVPGLTRMQVASHLQKCRGGNWQPPNERKPKTNTTETRPRDKIRRPKQMRFGSMPRSDNNSQLHLPVEEYHEMNNQELINMNSSTENNVLGDNFGYNPFSHDFETFNMDQLGLIFPDQHFLLDTQSVAPIRNTLSNQSVSQDQEAFDFSDMDFMDQQQVDRDCSGNLK